MIIRLRLVKVMVQPVFVVDDGKTLTERPAQALPIDAADWPSFPERLEALRIEQEAALNPADDAA